MICIVNDKPLTGWDLNFIEEKCARVGLHPNQISHLAIGEISSGAGKDKLKNANVLVALGETPLKETTGKSSIFKWHLSTLVTSPELGGRKAIPTFSVPQVKADWSLGLYVEMAFRRAREEMGSPDYVRKPKRFLLNPDLDQTFAILERLLFEDWISIDIETGRGQINTVGFAWSPSDAIAINVLPQRCAVAQYHKLWSLIAAVVSCPAKKIAQGGIYEILYFARYGITLENLAHDTMVAQKFLWPELDKGLDNVGRIYTREPYWKDDGRAVEGEGSRKDWGAIRDWPKHYDYNCKDSAHTLEAAFAQRIDLASREQLSLFDKYIMNLHTPLREMCLRGLPILPSVQSGLAAEFSSRSLLLQSELSQPINPRSWRAKLKLLKDKGYAIPKVPKKQKDGSKRGQESTSELALKKLRLKHPEDTDIQKLLEIAKLEKTLSSYLRVKTDPLDGNVRFTLDLAGTETGRWASYTDPWDRGFNAQTLNKHVKKMIGWADGRVFVQIDLKQAESRFVAYDSCDEDLIRMLEAPTKDIHRYVAAEIFQKPEVDIVHGERQLGKKSGHGANYSMAAATFQDSCLKEMDLVLSRKEAENVLEAYHRLFPGIRRWHKHIRDTVYRERCLRNPFGRVRFLYGRMNDATFREAYAYRPQSTVPDVINHLMLSLCAARTEGKFDFWLHLQCHDSLTLSLVPKHLDDIAEYALKTELWHPELVLPAGRLVIPTSIEWGRCLGEVKKYERR